MDDMSTKDFRHLVYFFNNSKLDSTIGDIDRYPEKTTPALFIVDPFPPDGDSNPHFTVCNVIGTHNPVTEANIAAKIDGKHIFSHVRCNDLSWPIFLFCRMPYELQVECISSGPAHTRTALDRQKCYSHRRTWRNRASRSYQKPRFNIV